MIQIETAMGSAVEVFEGSALIEVGRDRFVPVKSTSQLLLLRSDCYDLGTDFVLDLQPEATPYVELDKPYARVGEFDKRFPAGVPSLKQARSLVVHGDWTFGEGVRVVGDVTLRAKDGRGRVPAGAVLEDEVSQTGASSASG